MKKRITVLFFMFIAAFAFCKTKEEIIQPRELEKIIEQHPLVEKAEMDEIEFDWKLKTLFYIKIGREKYLPYYFDLYLTLTNGHTIKFLSVPNDLTFHKDGALQKINNVLFSSDKNDKWESAIYLKDLCKATDTDYYDLYTILDNYKNFCKLLNSIPWRLDKEAEKLCAKYSGVDYVDIYRGYGSILGASEKNKFIEIPEE